MEDSGPREASNWTKPKAITGTKFVVHKGRRNFPLSKTKWIIASKHGTSVCRNMPCEKEAGSCCPRTAAPRSRCVSTKAATPATSQDRRTRNPHGLDASGPAGPYREGEKARHCRPRTAAPKKLRKPLCADKDSNARPTAGRKENMSVE